MSKLHPANNSSRRRFLGHNFGIVYRFEVVRMLKKPSFWISILAFPALMALIFGISFIASKSTIDNAEEELQNNQLAVTITDDSGLVDEQTLSQMGVSSTSDKQAAIDQVKSGKIDAYFYYPSDLVNGRIEVYGKNISLFENSKYSALATSILTNSAQSETDPNLAVILSDQLRSDSHFYETNGDEANLIGDMIIPAVFLVLFYLIICIFSSQMLTATVEEKENRITEMLLTTISSRTLITGKIFAFITLVLLQALIIIGLVLGGYVVAAKFIDLPSIDLSIITIDPVRIAIAVALFVVSILMYSGIMVAIGAATPTAKEANSFMSVPILLMFAPLYIFSTVISEPDAPVVVALMFFPLTAPVLLMVLNALGTLSIANAVIGLGIMVITTIVIFIIAARLFQTGAIEYHKRIRLFDKKPAQKA